MKLSCYAVTLTLLFMVATGCTTPQTATRTINVAGEWEGEVLGNRTYPGKYHLILEQNGTVVSGTGNINDGSGRYYRTAVTGEIDGYLLRMRDTRVTGQVAPTENQNMWPWELKEFSLRQVGEYLKGGWTSEHQSGEAWVRRSQQGTDNQITTTGIANVSGRWQGVLYQPRSRGNVPYLFFVDISQQGTSISGTSRIVDGTNFGIMNMRGTATNSGLNFSEHEIASSLIPGGGWYLKNVTLELNGNKLTGTWSAGGDGGRIELTR